MDEGEREGQVQPDQLLAQALDEQRALFRAKFGRDPGPDDPLLFDPDADEPVPLSPAKLEAGMVDVLEVAGVDPAFVYAFQHTGLVVTEDTVDLLDEDDLAEWDAAVQRYRALHDEDEAGTGLRDDEDLVGLDDEDLVDLTDDFIGVPTHDARLFFASPDFDSATELASLLVQAVESSGILTGSVLWVGESSEGWPAVAIGVTYLLERWEWYISPYVAGYADARIGDAYLDHIAAQADTDVPHESVQKWYLPGDSLFDRDPAEWTS